jgi:hypothetical protein
MAEIVCCKYCGNPIDLENSYIHDTCKDWSLLREHLFLIL